MEKLISILVWLDMKLHKCTHKQWTGIDGYWIAYGTIGRLDRLPTKQEIIKPYLDKLKEQVEENSIIDYAEDLYDGGQLVISYFELCHIIDNLLSEQGE